MHNDKIGYSPNGYFSQLEIINNILFTAREIDIIACINHMRGSSKIASILDVSIRTAENHTANIKRKIDNNAREGIIDFVERSGKARLLRKHYQNLLIQADFNKKLKSIANVIHNNTPVCYLFCCNEKNKESIIPVIQNHLKLANVKLNIRSINEGILEFKQEEHFIYVVSDKPNNQTAILKALQESKRKPTIFTFLVTEHINHNLSRELIGTPYIDLLECKNYYLTIFEIFKRLSPRIDFDNIISQLECYHESVNDQQGLLESYNNQDFKKTVTDNANHYIKSGVPRKWLMGMLFGSMLVVIAGGYSKIMLEETDKKEKGITQRIFSKENTHFIITSYIPEILTGYEHFIGRQKELQQIEQKLKQDNIVIITGQGGIGKSSCAIEYGKLHKQKKIVRYLNAESTIKIDQQYRELAQELNINVEQQPRNVVMQLVNNKLNTLSTKILFIFDNIDQYDDAKEYLMNMPMNVKAIITTRQPRLIANKSHIAIEEFNREEAEKYLKNSLQNRCLTNDFIHTLIKNAGTLPYDLKCVAAYLIDNPSVEHKVAANEIASKIKDKLFEEFITSVDKTKQHAWKTLQYAANLDPEFISIEIINKLFPLNVELSSSALKKLESLSLISMINNENDRAGFKIHRKLQQNILNTAKHYAKQAISKQTLTNNLLNVLDQLFPEVLRNTNDQWRTARELYSNVAKLLNTEIKVVLEKDNINLANLYYKLAKYHMIVNVNYSTALKYAKTALGQLGAFNDNQDIRPKVANTYNIIGVIYERLGNTQEGFKHSKEGLKIRQSLYVGDHPEIADSLYTTGKAYKRLGETQQGIKYLQLALEMNKRLYPGNHYQIARCLGAIGTGYIDLGNFEKSLEYLKASLNILTALHPITPDKIADLQTNIAYNYNKLGNHKEALKYAKSSVELMKKYYPDGHPVTIYSMDDFGETLIKTNNVKQGLDILHKALAMTENFGMNKHFTTAWVLYNLGCGYFKNGDYPHALKYSEKALALRKEIYSNVKSHIELSESLYLLGNIHIALNNKDNGLQLYKESLEMYKALLLEHLPEVNEIKQKINELASV